MRLYKDLSTGIICKRLFGKHLYTGQHKWTKVKPVKIFNFTLFYINKGKPFYDWKENFIKL